MSIPVNYYMSHDSLSPSGFSRESLNCYIFIFYNLFNQIGTSVPGNTLTHPSSAY